MSQRSLSSKILESTPIKIITPKAFDAKMVTDFVLREQEKVEQNRNAKSEWKKNIADTGTVVARVVTKLKPVIEPLMPKSAEYTIPFGCLMMIFEVCVRRYGLKMISADYVGGCCKKRQERLRAQVARNAM